VTGTVLTWRDYAAFATGRSYPGTCAPPVRVRRELVQ